MQQNGSTAHTASQHEGSLQPVDTWGEQQSSEPQTHDAHDDWACLAQISSHCVAQQNASLAQTSVPQPASLHPGA
ncbi:MAG: hypothetical protein ACK56I_20805 [bacterium]